MEKVEFVFIPSPAAGHLGATIEFANSLLEKDERFSITVLFLKPPRGPARDYEAYFSCYPQIQFIKLQPIEPPHIENIFVNSIEKYVSVYIESYKDSVKEAIVNLVLPNSVRFGGLVVDMFSTCMIDVGNELGVPSYLFFASCAGFLGFLLHLRTRDEQGQAEFEESDADSVIPSYVNPVPANVVPEFALNKQGGYASFLAHARRFSETKGILVNTFFELENHAISSIKSAYMDLPHVYTIGPVINDKVSNQWQSNQEKMDEIMKWLDLQPPSSVVFLCFGSNGSFSKSQLKEIANGLEQSGHRFLWSIRVKENGKFGRPVVNINYADILPLGFLERTKKKGFLCGWTPQEKVLAHQAVRCFVSHCGWNSTLEGIWHGVPIVTWPMYAEQQINAFEIVRDLRLAVELKLDYRRESDDMIVKADEIEKAVRFAMEDDEVRKKAKDVSDKSRQAVADGGSSFLSIGRLIQAMLECV